MYEIVIFEMLFSNQIIVGPEEWGTIRTYMEQRIYIRVRCNTRMYMLIKCIYYECVCLEPYV